MSIYVKLATIPLLITKRKKKKKKKKRDGDLARQKLQEQCIIELLVLYIVVNKTPGCTKRKSVSVNVMLDK